MEGGIGIILLLVIVAIAAVIGVAMYITGGAIWAGKTSRKGDRVEGGEDGDKRPTHRRVTNESMEHTHLVGVRHDREREQ
jgi:hypothetical protein